MRYTLISVLMLVAFLTKADIHPDTVTYWQISYDKTVIIRGNLNSTRPPVHELTVNQGSLKNLTISFVYDAVQPNTSTLTVKEKNEVLRTVAHDPIIGPYFVVPVRELIGTHQPDVRYELDFYYTDDRGQKDLKIGTIIFIFK